MNRQDDIEKLSVLLTIYVAKRQDLYAIKTDKLEKLVSKFKVFTPKLLSGYSNLHYHNSSQEIIFCFSLKF